jgi:predicted DCC family thiol-disulfide oxidoreductase YuxK
LRSIDITPQRSSETSSTLVYDGECGICRYWVDYWRGLTKERVVYRPYQDAAGDFPAIPLEAFPHSIQFIEPDGRVYSGAAATFRVLHDVPGHAAWWWLYSRLPTFAPASECAYNFFSRRRGMLNRVSKVLWGPALEPERYELVSWVFLRLFGAIYVAAFASLGVQIQGLVGRGGILPLPDYLEAAHRAFGSAAYRILPTLFWLNASDTALVAGTVVGVLLGFLVILDLWTRPALIGLFVLYLSYVYAGQDFMSFQWDLLLLEAGFLAIFLTGGSRILIWLYRWLLFRYLFLAGAVKLLSGDASWRDLTALEYHFWTQPLPTPLAWYAAQFPHWLLAVGTTATLAVELGSVFLIFLPRRLRAVAACSVLLFQSLILLTGNYNFFNLLSMLMCVFLFDDAALRRVIPQRVVSWVRRRATYPGRAATVTATVLALIVVPAGVDRIWQALTRTDLPLAGFISATISPLSIVNFYGLFAMMTTARPEIVIEGSADGQSWREYVFRYKPGPVSRPPLWNIPHQPRLDWQMWFAALGGAGENPWFESLMVRLLESSPPVLALLDSNPFPDRPPKFVRAKVYDYRFADQRMHAATGQWWVRQLQGWYFPQVGLADFAPTNDAKTVSP